MQKKEIFSDRLCFLRKKCGLRSFDFAKKLGLSQSQVSRYENGINSPDIDMLAKIAEVLDANLHWLITGKPSPDAEKAIRILKPFAQARLSQITSDMQKLIDEIADLRAKGAVAMVFLTLKNKDTGEPVEITSLPLSGNLTLEKVQDCQRLKECQDELEDLQLHYKAVLNVISEFSE